MSSDSAEPVVIAGVSTRAFAESAVRAGVACTSVDGFGDLDQKARLANIGLRRDLGRHYGAAAAAAVASRLDARAATYVANFENHPGAVRRLSANRLLLGNAPDVLARVRDPFALADVARRAGCYAPLTLSRTAAAQADPARQWLRKPARGGGGSGVHPWRPGEPLRSGEIVQERIDGIAASAVFLADGRRAVVLGASEQLCGDHAFGATGFRYSGSLFPLRAPGAGATMLASRLVALADALAETFGLRGINGVDFVLRDGVPFVLEVNPRYPASAELIERATGLSMFAAHAAACAGELALAPAAVEDIWGRAIVFARRACIACGTRSWLDREDVRDVPFPGESFARGNPICSVFASGANAAGCRTRLVAVAAALEAELAAARDAEREVG